LEIKNCSPFFKMDLFFMFLYNESITGDSIFSEIVPIWYGFPVLISKVSLAFFFSKVSTLKPISLSNHPFEK